MTEILNDREIIAKMTGEEIVQEIDNLYSKWIYSKERLTQVFVSEDGEQTQISDITPTDYLELALTNFELDIDTVNFPTIEHKKNIFIRWISLLRLYLNIVDIDDDIKDKTIVKISALYRVVIDTSQTVNHLLNLKNSIIEAEIGKSAELDFTSYKPIDTSSNTPYQNLLLYLLEALMVKGYKRYQGTCYKKIYTDDGEYTHCWKEALSLLEFIYETVNKETNYEMWQNLTSSQRNAQSAVEYLQYHRGPEFETIEKDRHVFAFNNGIYFTCRKNEETGEYTDEFIRYGEKNISSDIVAAKYFRQNFEYIETDDWFKIVIEKCPHFRSIMTYQEWPEEVQRWLCIFMGRMLYNTGELDNWQVIAFLFGQAGSGKSTILDKIINLFYEDCDVGSISNNIEEKFGLYALEHKFIVIGPEIKANFRMEQAEFQSIISGETVQLAIKNKQAKTVTWKVPIILAGNEVPNYSDNSGSIARRMVVFTFEKKVKTSDTLLANKIEKEMSYIIQACNRAYLEKINTIGSRDIWNVVPQYFVKTREEMAANTNSLIHFLRSERFVFGKDKYMKESTFREMFNEHCKSSNLPKAKLTTQYFMGPFEQFGLVIKSGRKRYPNNDYSEFFQGNFIMGIDVAAPPEQPEITSAISSILSS